jgi:hypothetical protein
MRTKVLLLSAVLAALGVASSQAQVYSVNAVGYVNVTIDATTGRPNGAFAMITNPLDQGAGNYAVSSLIPAPPEGTVIFKYINGAYEPANVFELGEWGNANQTIEPGQGVFIKVPTGQSLTITFVGEVRQGAASNKALVAGFNMVGSLVPQTGALTGVLEYPADEGDVVYKYSAANQAYDPVYVFELGEWGPSDPVVDVGGAVFIKPAAARAWDRNFSVN